MKYQLIKPVNPDYSALEQILTNRDIKHEEIQHYINTTDDDINSFLLLGENLLKEAAMLLMQAIGGKKNTLLIVDCDCDGYTSSALFINYLYILFPAWTENHVHWYMHKKKQHGLEDCCDWIIEQNKYSLVVILDAGTNDNKEHEKLKNVGIDFFVIDHHEVEDTEKTKGKIIINNQYCNYPNKQLSGVGLTWQFCRYLDALLEVECADRLLDLVALGLTGDMQDLTEFETKHLINKGFLPENIHNPFIYYMWQKNKFKLGEHITSWGAAFYIVPFINAITRSGTQEEKEVVFQSMLTMKAFQIIPSTKKGCKGENEQLVEQAIRVCTNVKNRQTKKVDESMMLLESMIQEDDMLEDKVLLFLLKNGQIDSGIAGLTANKIMAKYQRPCCILQEIIETTTLPFWDENAEYYDPIDKKYYQGAYVDKEVNITYYQGSARGCDKVGVLNFKDDCNNTNSVVWTIGHKSAFGVKIQREKIDDFIQKTNEIYKDMSKEPIYYVDYIYNGEQVNAENILDIAEMGGYWGKSMDESLVAVKGLKITKEMITLMSPDKTPTLKISLPNGVSIIKFRSSEEEYKKLTSESGFVEIDIIGKCNSNFWLGNNYPQIIIEEYQIIDTLKYYF